MVKAPVILTLNTLKLSNATHSSDVAVETERDVIADVSVGSNSVLIADNAPSGSTNYAATNSHTYTEKQSMKTARAEELSETNDDSTSSSISDSHNNIGIKNDNEINNTNISSTTSEQSTQTDEDDNSSNSSLTNSIRYFANDCAEDQTLAESNGKNEVNASSEIENTTCDNVSEVISGPDIENATGNCPDKIEESGEGELLSAEVDEGEEETYCVGHFYGQDEEETKPEAVEMKNTTEQNCDNEKSSSSRTTGLQTVQEVNENSESKHLIENAELPSSISVGAVVPSVTKSYNIPNRPIPQIIGVPGIMAQQHLMPASTLHKQQKQHQPQQSAGGLLQPLHLTTLGAHSSGAVNQQISPTPATASAVSTAIQHHHCVHHPHVHIHSPGQQAAATTGAAAGHPHTHIFPLQVISLTQGTTAGAAAGAATAWPLVEAPIYVDANGEYRTYCPAHPQGPPPREHRFLLQLDAGVSLPLQIAGKRKVFRGKCVTFIDFSSLRR